MGTWTGRRVGRRWLLVQSGRGAVGIAVLGVAAACSDTGSTSARTADPAEDEASPTRSAPDGSGTSAAGVLAWSRVNLGFVSAYVLVRGNEAAVVDTGVGGSAEAIGRCSTRPGRAGPVCAMWC
jgi:hypothetical protein